MPFWLSISMLGLVQAGLVALPRAPLPPLPWGLGGLRSAWWALVPAASIVVVIAAVNFFSASADLLTYLALVAVPPLAAVSLALLIRGARPAWAWAVAPLFALAWAAGGALSGEVAATALSALSCIALGWLLVAVVPAAWLRLGIYAMAAVDTYLVAADLLQGPNSVLTVAAPAAALPRLQVVHFGSATMGFGDLFVAGVVGCLLVGNRAIQRRAALLVAAFALLLDLLFFAVDTLPATVPVAVALAVSRPPPARRQSRRRESGAGRIPAGR